MDKNNAYDMTNIPPPPYDKIFPGDRTSGVHFRTDMIESSVKEAFYARGRQGYDKLKRSLAEVYGIEHQIKEPKIIIRIIPPESDHIARAHDPRLMIASIIRSYEIYCSKEVDDSFINDLETAYEICD